MRPIRVMAMALLLFLVCPPSLAQSANDALLPEHITESSARRFPEILASFARERAARGDQLAAEGAFDLVFDASGFDRVSGFWTGGVVNAQASQNLRQFGANVYGGYRVSDGTFPIYEDINFTNSGGEFKIGTLFSLLRDRAIDPRRFRARDTELASAQASLDVTLTQVGVQLRALNAYWRWVAAGRELDVYRDLLNIAQARQSGLTEQVRQGAQPEIALTENAQNIIRRQILLTDAERNLAVAANALSFYLRDASGNTIIPLPDQVPQIRALPQLQETATATLARPSNIILNRPELRGLQLAIDRARNKVSLGQNDLKPQLDLRLEVSRDVGAIAEGGFSRDSTDTIVGFSLSVPLQRREAKGRLQRAEAELRATELARQQLEDQIEIEIQDILINLTTALKLSALAIRNVEQSEAMVDAERRRFGLGASDFFLVNIREETAADARIRAIRADLTGRLADTSYNAATMNMAALGL